MKFAALKRAVAGFAIAITAQAAQAQDWEPQGPIKMMISFRAGGGADTLGRLLAEDLSSKFGWEIIPENLAGKGGGAMLAALKDEPADGQSIGVTVGEAVAYGAQAARNPGYGVDDFTYLSTLTGTQVGIIAKTSRGWTSLGDVIDAAKAGEKITIGAMTPMLADGAYVIAKNNGVDFTTVMVQGGKGGVNGVVADDIDIAWAAGVQTSGVMSGDLVNLVSAEAEPLKISPEAPLLSEFNVPFTFGTKFITVGPAGIPDEARDALVAAIAEVLNDPESKLAQFTNKAFSGPELIQGDDLAAYVRQAYEDAGALLDATSQ